MDATEDISFQLVYTLAGMLRHQSAADLALSHGPDLFPDAPAQAVAWLIMRGEDWPLKQLGRKDRKRATAIGRRVVVCGCPGNDEAWAICLVRWQAQERARPMLSAWLRAAADKIESGEQIDKYAAPTAAMFALGDAP